MYDESVANLRNALARYLKSGERPDPKAPRRGPVRLSRAAHRLSLRSPPRRFPPRAFGRLNQPGRYATSIARPYLFRKYLTEQLTYLIDDYDVEVSVGRSASEIPYPYVLDGTDDLRLDGAQAADLALWFPTTELAHIGDEIADGEWLQPPGAPRPLSLFDGPRVDFSLARLRHYTGTPVRAHPALPAVHQLCPLCRRVRPLGGRRAEASRTAPIEACRRPAASTSPRTRPTRSSRSRRAAGAGTRCRPIT